MRTGLRRLALDWSDQCAGGSMSGLRWARSWRVNRRGWHISDRRGSTGVRLRGRSSRSGLNKHPYTEALLPLIGEFEALTGIKVDYLILPGKRIRRQAHG